VISENLHSVVPQIHVLEPSAMSPIGVPSSAAGVLALHIFSVLVDDFKAWTEVVHDGHVLASSAAENVQFDAHDLVAVEFELDSAVFFHIGLFVLHEIVFFQSKPVFVVFDILRLQSIEMLDFVLQQSFRHVDVFLLLLPLEFQTVFLNAFLVGLVQKLPDFFVFVGFLFFVFSIRRYNLIV